MLRNTVLNCTGMTDNDHRYQWQTEDDEIRTNRNKMKSYVIFNFV